MNQKKSKTVQVSLFVASIIGAFIAAGGFSLSVYRQYTFIYHTLDSSSDLVSLALSYLAPFCVDGFIIYAVIRIRYEWQHMSVAEAAIIILYAVLMVVAAIVANIIEANRALGLPITDRHALAAARYVLPIIPIASSLVMFIIHLSARRSPVEQALAEMAEELDLETVRLTTSKTRAQLPQVAEANAAQYAATALGTYARAPHNGENGQAVPKN